MVENENPRQNWEDKKPTVPESTSREKQAVPEQVAVGSIKKAAHSPVH